LPKMLLRDIIARWYGWKVGDVVKITRRDEVYYRMIF
jgi:DNA-directed RNA polymerase subunit H (RpoH/RPB5)